MAVDRHADGGLVAGPGIADQRGLVTGLVGHAGTRLRVAAGRTSIDFLARVSYSYHRIGVRHGRGKGFTKAVGSGDGAAVCTTDASGRGRWRRGEGGALPEARAHPFIPTIYLHDNCPGGIGLSELLFHKAPF
jgi:hypothetical protein